LVTLVSLVSVGPIATRLAVPELGDGGIQPPQAFVYGGVDLADGLDGGGPHGGLELAALSQHDGVLLGPVLLELSQGESAGIEEDVRKVFAAHPVGFGWIG
jgi:hypothetical protein